MPAQDEVEAAMRAALAGAPAALAALYDQGQGQRAAILRGLLAEAGDGAVAQAFAQLWQGFEARLDDPRLNDLRWYLRAEARSPGPLRQAVHRDVLIRLFQLPALPATEAGHDLVFAAARVAVEMAAPAWLHGLADACLQRQAALFLADPGAPPRAGLIYAALGTVNLGLLRRLAARASAGPGGPDGAPAPVPEPEAQKAMGWALGMLLDFQGSIDAPLRGWIEAAHASDPGAPGAVLRLARMRLRMGAEFGDLLALFLAMRDDPGDPHLRAALEFAHGFALNEDLEAEAQGFAARLSALAPEWSPAPAPAAPTAAAEAARAPEPGADLAALLAHAHRLAAADLAQGGANDAAGLSAAFAALGAAILAAPEPPGWGPERAIAAAEALVRLDQREYDWIAHFIEAPHAQGPDYGLIDLALIPVMHRGLMQAAAGFAEAALNRLLQGAPMPGAWVAARLIQLHGLACRRMEAPERALALLALLAAWPHLAELRAVEADNARLHAGLPPDAAPPSRQGARALPLLDHGAWSAAEGLAWHPLAQDAPTAGQYLVFAEKGAARARAHLAPGGAIAWADVPGLSLLSEDIPIGPGGHGLRPARYHTSRDFPRESLAVVAGQGASIRIRPQGQVDLAQPVVVLEAFEALQWHNYFHWMVPLLSRLALARASGLLEGRKLVVPRGLRRWMIETLDLIGLGAPARIEVAPGDLAHLADARLISAIEHVSPAALAALREALVPKDAPKAPPKDGPCLFLSRQSQRRRKLANEPQVEELAEALGFEVIFPEGMTVAAQIALFSRARAVAAPEGAALTNILFCPPGTRVLSFICLNDMMPVFTDISTVLGHDHALVPGPGLEGQPGANRFQPPFAVPLDAARRGLAWAAGQSRRPTSKRGQP